MKPPVQTGDIVKHVNSLGVITLLYIYEITDDSPEHFRCTGYTLSPSYKVRKPVQLQTFNGAQLSGIREIIHRGVSIESIV